MRGNPVKDKLAVGETVLGTFVFEFASSGIARLAAEAGAEFVVFDMEHTGWSFDTIRALVASAGGAQLVPMVRIPTAQYHFVARALDVGARGVMAPMVESVEQARLLADSAKYPPVGRRGAAFGIAHDDYTGGDIVSKIATANQQTLVIAQIETAQGLAAVEAIAAVEGIDVLWIGHFDLTNSLGIPGQFNHPQFRAAKERVLAACRAHGKAAGFMAGDIAGGKALLEEGFRILAYGGDLWLYQAALRTGLESLRIHGRGDP